MANEGWQHRFTFLRLQPSLIWGDEARPRCFAGTVKLVPDDTVLTSEASELASSQPQTIPDVETPEPFSPGQDFAYLDDLMDML